MRNQRVKLVLLCGLLLLAYDLTAQSPGGISRQSFWLRGDPSSEAAKKNTLNFHPAIAMVEGKSRAGLPDNVGQLKRVTVFTVYQPARAAEETAVWELNGEFGDIVHSTRQVSSNSSNSKIEFAEAVEAIISTYTGSHRVRTADRETSLQLGAPSLMISEFILYEKILSAKEVTKVETYLAIKYGITLQKNYISASGKTVWDREKDKAYSNNIAGIARDDQSALNQKQGTSCNNTGQLVIGVNKIAASNNDNTDRLNDGDYLVWGDNGQAITFDGAEICNGDVRLPAKKWLMRTSGSTTNKIGTELKFDTKSLLTAELAKEHFCLVIDRSGTGEFAPENCIYIIPDSISADGIASFTGVSWDTDGSGKDVFTFGLKTGLSHDSLVRINF